jgi:hypothetical protein
LGAGGETLSMVIWGCEMVVDGRFSFA